MELTSPAFQANQEIPPRYTCDEENEHPPLVISDVPEGTRTFALIMHDPDAVSGDFVHWLLWNIPSSVQGISSGMSMEEAVQGQNDFGEYGYGGPCPPSGMHHYHFELYAVDIELDLPTSSKRDEVLRALEGHELAKAELIGLYQREEEMMPG